MTLHQSLLKNSIKCLETSSPFLATPSYLTRDSVRIFTMALERKDYKDKKKQKQSKTDKERKRQDKSEETAKDQSWISRHSKKGSQRSKE
ncbi:hypothetical protein Tco_0794113 [Tanacetum coccineum]